MKNYKLIVTDMDGTVLGANHQLTEENKRALREAEKMGIKTVFATGRFHESAKVHVGFLEHTMPIISSNGSIIKHPETNEVIYTNSIDKETCLKIMDILDNHNLSYQVYTDEIILQKYNTEEEKKMMIDYIKKVFSDKTEINFRKDLRDDLANKNVLKFNVMDLERVDLLEKAREDFKKLENIEVTSSWNNNLEIMSEGSNKGNAVEFLAGLLNIDKKNIIAFGDNYNDISMLEYVGTGIAMGNAEEDVKKVASYVTDKNHEDGVAKALNKLVLQNVLCV